MIFEHRAARLLDQALQRLQTGESLERILASHPLQAAWLGPQLRLASAVRSLRWPTPSSSAQARGWARLQAALAEPARPRPTPRSASRPLPALAAALCVLTICLGVAFAASGRALPGDPLYPLKLAAERIPMLFARDPAVRAEYELDGANGRLAEAQALLDAHTEERRVRQALENAETAIEETIRLRSLVPAPAPEEDVRLVAVVKDLGALTAASGEVATLEIEGRVDVVAERTITVGGLPMELPSGPPPQPGDWVAAIVEVSPAGQTMATTVELISPPTSPGVGPLPPTPTVVPTSTPTPQPSATPSSTPKPRPVAPVIPTVPAAPTPTAPATPTPTVPQTQTPTEPTKPTPTAPVQPPPTALVEPPPTAPAEPTPTAPPKPTATPTPPAPTAIVGTPVVPTVPPTPTPVPEESPTL